MQSSPECAVCCHDEDQAADVGVGWSIDQPNESGSRPCGCGKRTCPAGSDSSTQCCERGSFLASTPKVWGQEEGRACGSLDPNHQRLSLNCSRHGLHPVGIFLFGGWTPCPVDKGLQGVQEGK
jgi:hypothetical protein